MAHTSSRRDQGCHMALVPVADLHSWEEGAVEWHSSSVHTNFRYFEDLSWKAKTRAPKQWARHKRKGVGPLTLKRSLAHWHTSDEGTNGQVLSGWDEFLRVQLELMFEHEFA